MTQPVPTPNTPPAALPAVDTLSSTPRWRRVAGRSVTILALAVAIAAGVVAGAESQRMLVLGAVAVSRPVLFGTVVVAGIAMTASHVLSRGRGPFRDGERAVVRGVVASLAGLWLIGVPLVGFVVLILLYGFLDSFVSPMPLAVMTVAIVAGAAVLRQGEPPTAGREVDVLTDRSHRPWTSRSGVRWVASALLTAGVMVLTGWVLGWGFFTTYDDVVVATEPDGCTAVVRQDGFALFSGEAVLYVAAPGSVVAHRRTAYPLESAADIALEAGAQEVRIAFDAGFGAVDEVVSCR